MASSRQREKVRAIDDCNSRAVAHGYIEGLVGYVWPLNRMIAAHGRMPPAPMFTVSVCQPCLFSLNTAIGSRLTVFMDSS